MSSPVYRIGMNDLEPVNDFKPWDVYRSFTPERLSIVAEIIRESRRGTLALYDPMGGDNGWSHECRAYARSCFALTQAAKKYGWLRIIPEWEPLKFTFAIDSVPCRFYHGAAADQPSRYSTRTDGELNHLQLALKLDGLRPIDTILRFAVETDAERQVTGIILVESDEVGNVTNVYAIPVVAATAKSNIVPAQSAPIDLPAPTLEPLEKPQEQAEDRTRRK